MPLGRLISQFEKFTDDKALVRDLRALVKDRNHYAHRGYLQRKGSDTLEKIMAEIQSLQEVKDRTDVVNNRLKAHIESVGSLVDESA